MTGSLVLVCTPIGNLADLSPRAIEALRGADFWLVEDTRVSGKLLFHLGLKKPMNVLNEHTDEARIERYLSELASGKQVALLSDGGAPVISDPGARITDLCHERGIPVDAIPGPSAVANALMLSGFYGQRFVFLGFLPRKPGAMRSQLDPFRDSPLPIVLFESPFRIDALIAAASESLGERRYAVCREMTKMHQQIFRATLPIIPSVTEVPRKGEVTVVIEGRRRGDHEPE
jgi:16S rRNA (cytidine1402-2'-O)-methyltransferase